MDNEMRSLKVSIAVKQGEYKAANEEEAVAYKAYEDARKEARRVAKELSKLNDRMTMLALQAGRNRSAGTQEPA